MSGNNTTATTTNVDPNTKWMNKGDYPLLPPLEDLCIVVEAGWECIPDDENENCSRWNPVGQPRPNNERCSKCGRAPNSEAIILNKYYLEFGTRGSPWSKRFFKRELKKRFYPGGQPNQSAWDDHLEVNSGPTDEYA